MKSTFEKIIILIGILLLSGCSDIEKEKWNKNDVAYQMRDICINNLETLDCLTLISCDRVCNDLMLVSHSKSCHLSFTNQIIAKCQESRFGNR